MVRQNSETENPRRAEGNSETAGGLVACKTQFRFGKNPGGGAGLGGADGGAVVPVHVVAASRRRRKKTDGKRVGAARHPRVAEAGKKLQRLLAVAEQGDDETLFTVPAMADSGAARVQALAWFRPRQLNRILRMEDRLGRCQVIWMDYNFLKWCHMSSFVLPPSIEPDIRLCKTLHEH